MGSRVPNHRRRARAAGTATAPERSASAENRLSSGRKTAISLRRRVAAAEEIQGVHGCADQLLERVRLEIAGACDCMRGCLSREMTRRNDVCLELEGGSVTSVSGVVEVSLGGKGQDVSSAL